jgi:hypothetical protein
LVFIGLLRGAMQFITEPMTMATDYLLAGLAGAFAGLLLAKARHVRKSAGWWVPAFLVTAVAAAAGGTAHGFALYLGETNLRLVWAVTIVAIALSAILMIVAGIRSAKHPATKVAEDRMAGRRWLKGAVADTIAGLAFLPIGWPSLQHFNHNDLYHVVQMVGLYFLYRAAVFLQGLRGAVPEGRFGSNPDARMSTL